VTRDDDPSTAPPALRAFVALFDKGRFWDAHEMLEDAWRARRSDFYHGLILLASAFVHVQRRNRHGVLAQIAKARRRLEGYRPRYLGIDVDVLLEEAAAWEGLARREPPDEWVSMRPLPRITTDDAGVSGHEPELADRTEED
jgi:uncharacterized protein